MKATTCALIALCTGLSVTGQDAETAHTYDHLLYVRHNRVDGAAKTDSLVLARLGAQGVAEQRDVYTRSNVHVGWRPLCAVDGKLYALKIDRLWEIDLHTNEARQLGRQYIRYQSAVRRGDVLYALVHDGGTSLLRIFDFRRRCFRDLTLKAEGLAFDPAIDVSPDCTRLALMVPHKPEGAPFSLASRFLVVDLTDGSSRHVGEAFTYIQPPTSSKLAGHPPFRWCDDRTLAVLASGMKDPDKAPAALGGGKSGNGQPTVVIFPNKQHNSVWTVDVVTGKTAALAPVPGDVWRSSAGFSRDDATGRLFLNLTTGLPAARVQMRYRIYVGERRLEEDDYLGGQYRLTPQRPRTLCHGENELCRWDRGHPFVAVAPDGRRAAWLTSARPRRLQFHELDSGEVRDITDAWTARSLFWLSGADIARPTEPTTDGWTPFSEFVPPEPVEPRRDERLPVAEHLAVIIRTGRGEYALHEPVDISVTLTNIGDTELTVLRPVVVDSIHNRASSLVMKYPRGSKLVDGGAEPYVPKEEKIQLKPGQDVTCTKQIEVGHTGEYTLEYEYKGYLTDGGWGKWRGYLRAEPVRFTVAKTASASKLADAKFKRLLAALRRQVELAPEWDGYNEIASDRTHGIPALGAEFAPRVADAIVTEARDAPALRRFLFLALAQMPHPDAVPFLGDHLLEGPAKDCGQICRAVIEVWRTHRGSRHEAVKVLARALDRPEEEVRNIIIRSLTAQNGADITDAMQRLLDHKVEIVRIKAARYLADRAGQGLTEWLAATAAEPGLERYLAARTIVQDLENFAHEKRGELPTVSYAEARDTGAMDQFRATVRAWEQWAKENPAFANAFFKRDR